jgi:hypothetical protein
MLESLEWLFDNWPSVDPSKDPNATKSCPYCGCSQEEGHADTCELAAVLGRPTRGY